MSEFETLDVLMNTVKQRMKASPEESYTAKLVAKGREKICQKVGEEAVELGLAAVQGQKKNSISESVDLLYHLCVLWTEMGIKPKQLMKEIRKREGLSGLEEKRSRGIKNDIG